MEQSGQAEQQDGTPHHHLPEHSPGERYAEPMQASCHESRSASPASTS